MKKNMEKGVELAVKNRFYVKSLRSLVLFSLILPLILRLFVDIPSIALDYICHSYAPFYPTATTVGIVTIQIAAVLADILRAGFMGCVICILLYMIDKNAGKSRIGSALGISIVCPALVSGIGIYLTKLCVTTGLSRQTVYEFEAKLPDIKMSALIELALYAVVMVSAILCLLLRKNHLLARDNLAEQDGDSFFPSTSLFGTVAISIGISGVISLLVRILETVAELETYNVTESFEGIVSYLVLPYLYLAMELFAMICFAAIIYRRIDKKWRAGSEKGEEA